MARFPNMQSRQIFARSVDSLARAWALACIWACSSILGIDEMELPRVRIRVKPPTTGDFGALDSVTSDEVRECDGPRDEPCAGATLYMAELLRFD
jgi:hypothetical protein